ncbi:MAG: hypothetical protein AB1782_12675 [Cyanobacteriota bacterium]
MDKELTKLAIVNHVQSVVEQMRIDDIENSPGAADEEYQCPCCGDIKNLAGSMIYGDYLFCNDCVLLTEVSIVLDKIKKPEEMIELMEDKRFDNIYQSLFGELEQ